MSNVMTMINNPKPAPNAAAWIRITTPEQMIFATNALSEQHIQHKAKAITDPTDKTKIRGVVWVEGSGDAVQMVIATVHSMCDAGLLASENEEN